MPTYLADIWPGGKFTSRQCKGVHLDPGDYFLFPNLRKWLSERRLSDNDDILVGWGQKIIETLNDVHKSQRRLP